MDITIPDKIPIAMAWYPLPNNIGNRTVMVMSK